MTVTRRRSATAAGGCTGPIGDAGLPAAAPAAPVARSAVPQERQNRAPGLMDAPHAGHASASGAPHSSQKRAPGSLADPHRAQFMWA